MEKYVRQIQLAKGAVKAGIDLILETGGIGCHRVPPDLHV
jgi:uncharacterized 2Fe-2S/4Fe-4S cluster protein (DUF4445 family)